MVEETALDWYRRSHPPPLSSPNGATTTTSGWPIDFDAREWRTVWEDATAAFLGRSISIQDHENTTHPPFVFQQGTHIRFVDAVLTQQSNHSSSSSSSSSSQNVVLEMVGATGMGTTAISLSIAASFVAATSPLVYRTPGEETIPSSCLPPAPEVVIVDSTYAIHAGHLASTVRASVLRMWETHTTSRDHRRTSPHQAHQAPPSDMIEQIILSCLSRIHITRPRESGVGVVSTLEVIRYTLDTLRETLTKAQPKPIPPPGHATFGVPLLEELSPPSHPTRPPPPPPPCPPMMILLDSFHAFDYQDQMLESIHPSSSLPSNPTPPRRRGFGKSGLSGQTDVVRQLQRLLQSQDKNILLLLPQKKNATSSPSPTSTPFSHPHQPQPPWSSIITHRLSFDRVIPGTTEDQLGYTHVALLDHSSYREEEDGPKSGGGGSGPTVIPYSLAWHGIRS